MSETFRPFWLQQALAAEQRDPANQGNAPTPLQGDLDVDICIVGGGYTGLWTAIMVRQARPDWRIAVIERDLCGAGASGRNGGCMLTWSTKFLSLAQLFGAAEAARLVQASEQAVTQIADFCRAHAIDAEVRTAGAVYAASNDAQVGAIDSVLQALQKQGINRWRSVDAAECESLAGSARMRHGVFTDAAGSVQPARLVRGLRRVALAMGVAVHEKTSMLELRQSARPQVQTGAGCITATQIVLATNADMARQFPQFARDVVLVSSDMVITEPRPDLIAAIGLDRGQAVCDLRTFVHYWRSTPDGRLMLGKGGNEIAFGNRMLRRFDQPSRYRSPLQQALQTFFPALAEVPIAASWTGASDRSATGFPFFGRLSKHANIFYGFGYSGNGVVQSYLGGSILSSLLLGADNAWTRSGLTRGPLASFPPEPVRWCGAMLVRDAIRRKERCEDAGMAPHAIDRYLSRFARMASKADEADKVDAGKQGV